MAQVIAFPRHSRPAPGAQAGVAELLELARQRAEWNCLNPRATDAERDAAHAALAERLGL